SRYAPGLFATALLAELGADVVTIEPPRATEAGPEAGDAPSFPRYGMPAARAAGTHPLWRGRSIVALDLKSADGRSAAVELVRGADVVVEGFRPGVAERLGLGFDDLVEVNERIVVCSLTGWGRDVPGAHRAGHDLNYLAETGVLAAG